jgi:hypothetical protein
MMLGCVFGVPQRVALPATDCHLLSASQLEPRMKDKSIAAAIVLLAVSIFFTFGGRATPPVNSDQYLVNGGTIFRFPGAVQGRIEVLDTDAHGNFHWAPQDK